MNEVHTLYKLIILYLIRKISFPLTNGQLCAFMAEVQYTDYFTLQEILADMVDAKLLEAETIRNTTHYSVTESGADTLNYFGDQISSAIRNDIEAYLRKYKLQIREENAVVADYTKQANGEFVAKLSVKEKEDVLIHLELSVPTEQQAILLCDNWQKKNSSVYRYLMQELM